MHESWISHVRAMDPVSDIETWNLEKLGGKSRCVLGSTSLDFYLPVQFKFNIEKKMLKNV